MYTELELVNHMLHVAGEDSTPTLDTTRPDVVVARQTLASYNKEFQGQGWWFNKEYAVKLLPDSDGKVQVPNGAIQFKVTNCLLQNSSPVEQARFVRRGGWVYDTVRHTDIIKMAVWADLVMLLPYEDMPPASAAYLKHLAAERYFLDSDGDVAQSREIQQRTMRAWAMLQQEQLQTLGVNALNTSTGRWLRHGVPQLNRIR